MSTTLDPSTTAADPGAISAPGRGWVLAGRGAGVRGSVGARLREPIGTTVISVAMLVVAYLASYAVGAVASFVLLQRTVGGLQARRLVRFLVRMVLVLAVAGGAAWLVELALAGLGERPGPVVGLLRGGTSALVGLLVLLVASRLVRLREVTTLVDTVAARLRRR